MRHTLQVCSRHATPPAHIFTDVCVLLAWQKKRKVLATTADDESDGLPLWVLSPGLFDLYHAGKKPPAEVQLSAKAAKEVKRLKAENRQLREDVAILKAATTFFAGELDPRNR